MLKRIIDAPPSLKRFLDARSKGASEEELKALRAADEAARDHRTDVVVQFPADRERSDGEGSMSTGIVKMFNADKGYGFIKPDDGAADLFVHIRSCAEDIEELRKGQRVRFDQRTSSRSGKPEAFAVALIK